MMKWVNIHNYTVSIFHALPQSATNQLEAMKAFINPSENFKAYRDTIKESHLKGKAYIPYFGVMTRDIFCLENANPKLTINVPHEGSISTLLNVKRCKDIQRTIDDVLR